MKNQLPERGRKDYERDGAYAKDEVLIKMRP